MTLVSVEYLVPHTAMVDTETGEVVETWIDSSPLPEPHRAYIGYNANQEINLDRPLALTAIDIADTEEWPAAEPEF